MKSVPIISPGATSVEYTDKTPLPFLLRTVGSDKLQFDAFSQLARLFGWKRMAVVSQQTAYGVAQVNELKASLEDGGVVLWAQFMVAVGKEVERSIGWLSPAAASPWASCRARSGSRCSTLHGGEA